MKNKNFTIAFIKLLGSGRAWKTPTELMFDFYELLISPLKNVYDYFLNLKYVHFPTVNLNINDIKNGEELFGIKPKNEDSINERAQNIELSWQKSSNSLNYKVIENYLNDSGFKVKIIENVNNNSPDLGQGFFYGNTKYNALIEDKKAQYGGHFCKVIGNGLLNINGKNKDPVIFKDGKNSFYIKGYKDLTISEWEKITDILLKIKPAHSVAICQIAERKIANNEWYNTEEFQQSLDGGSPDTIDFFEEINL